MSQFAAPFICAGQEAAGRLNPVSCHASLILSNLGLQGRGLHLVLPFPPLPSQISISSPKYEFAKVSVQSDAQETVFKYYMESLVLC